jgi:transcriptional regulator with XRE-family HTH domain
LPIIHLALNTGKPNRSDYPKVPKTIGEHIKKRRMDLKLLQKDIGQRLGVHCLTITNWELGKTKPEIRHLPTIISFLGYDPRSMPVTIPERLVWYREGKGWAQVHFAGVLGVDPSTIAKWERGERKPLGRYLDSVKMQLIC